jgi:site-specific DNA recombinase
MVTMKPPYGFRYNTERDGLTVYEPEMAVVERIFGWAAEGAGTKAIQSRLRAEGVPSPKGNENWWRQGIKRLVMNDLYKPHTYEEVAKLVSDEVASRLDPDKEYGIRWANQKVRRTRQIAESDGNGGKRYRKRYSDSRRPREEWVAIPVPAHLPRELVEQARSMMEAHRAPQRKYLARSWELRGILRCGCGVLMSTHNVRASAARTDKSYHYYKCPASADYKCGLCSQKLIRAEPVEAEIWDFVSGLLKDPERIRAGMQELIDQERSAGSSDSTEEIAAWSTRLEECERLRRAYQDQQAAGLMTLEELRERLGELEDTRKLARLELDTIAARRERVEDLERDRDALLEEMAAAVPGALDDLSPEGKNRVYRMLRLSVVPGSSGYEVSGAFCSAEQFHPRRRRRRSGLPWRAAAWRQRRPS